MPSSAEGSDPQQVLFCLTRRHFLITRFTPWTARRAEASWRLATERSNDWLGNYDELRHVSDSCLKRCIGRAAALKSQDAHHPRQSAHPKGPITLIRNQHEILFQKTSVSGVQYDTVIPPLWAELAEDGLILSFVLPPTEEAPHGSAFWLQDANLPMENSMRKFAALLAELGLRHAGMQAFRRSTGQPISWPTALIVSQKLKNQLAQIGIFSRIEAHIPRVLNKRYVYLDESCRVAFREMFYAK